MLYFEDFMEAIENVPDELNEKLVKLRHLDQLSENAMEPIPSVTRAFFEDCKYNRLSEYEKTLQYSELVKEYEKASDHCKEKRDIVEKIHSTYKNLVRKLDTELEKFRLELEADNSGITEQIEQRINVMLGKAHSPIHKPDKRRQRFRYQQTGHFKNPFLMRRKIVGQARRTVLKSSTTGRPPSVHALKSDVGPTASSSRLSKITGLKDSRRGSSNSSVNRDSPGLLIDDHTRASDGVGLIRRMRSSDYLHESALYDPDDIVDTKSFSSTSGLTKTGLEADDDEETAFSMLPIKNSPFFCFDHTSSSNLLDKSTGGFSGGGSRMQRVGSVGNHGTSSDLSDSRTPCLDSRTSSAPSPVGWTPSGGPRRGRGTRRRDLLLLDELGASESGVFDDANGLTTSNSAANTTDGFFDSSTSGAFGLIPSTETGGPGALDEEDEEHKRYCLCNDVSYGDMIACDSPHCPFEWFHYSCVNLNVAPKGDWYCPHCIKSYFGTKMMKKRIGRR